MTTLPVMLQDPQLQETVPCGSDSFPIQYYVDNLSQWCQQSVPLHWHPYLEFFSVESGVVEVQVGSERLTLVQGEAIFISGNLLHGYRQLTGTPICICPNIQFAAQLIAPVSSSIYNKYLLPLFYNPQIPYVVFKPGIEWQQQILATLVHLYTLLSKYGATGYYPSNPDNFLPKNQVFSDCFELEVLQDLCHSCYLLLDKKKSRKPFLISCSVMLLVCETIRFLELLFHIKGFHCPANKLRCSLSIHLVLCRLDFWI